MANNSDIMDKKLPKDDGGLNDGHRAEAIACFAHAVQKTWTPAFTSIMRDRLERRIVYAKWCTNCRSINFRYSPIAMPSWCKSCLACKSNLINLDSSVLLAAIRMIE